MRPLLRFEVHPDNPQARQIQAVADRLRAGAIAAAPTAGGYLPACRLDDKTAATRLLRQADERQPIMLLCRDLAQAAAYLRIDDHAFRAVREVRRGSAAFLLRCTHRVPRRLTAGAGGTALLYFAGHIAGQGLLDQLDEPLLVLPSSDGLQTIEQSSADRLAGLDVALDAGPLRALEDVDCVELVPVARRLPLPWGRASAIGLAA